MDDRFKHSMDETNSYCDSVAVLTRAEFAVLHDHFKGKVEGSESEYHQAMVSILDSIQVLLADEDDRFHVTVFEWESGY